MTNEQQQQIESIAAKLWKVQAQLADLVMDLDRNNAAYDATRLSKLRRRIEQAVNQACKAERGK